MHKIHHKTPVDLALFHRLDMNLYPMFIAIYEQKSISKAAQILSLSQSAVSHALQRLRDYLQDDLFVRAGSKMRATPFAEQIYPTIQAALLSIQSISVQKQQFEPSMLKNLKIAVHDEIEPIIFPKLVHHFQQLDLDIQFLSMKLDRKTVAADLASQQIDFVIDLEQDYGSNVQFQALLKDEFMVCTQHIEMNSALYLSSPHLGVSSRRSGILLEDVYLQQKQLSRHVVLRCQHYSTALQILQQQPNTILTIPQHILSQFQISDQLNIFQVPVDLPKLNLGMYWNKNLKENLRQKYLKNEIYQIFT